MQALAMRSVNFTGADLTALVREAGLAALSVRSNLYYICCLCVYFISVHASPAICCFCQALMTQLAYPAFVAQLGFLLMIMLACCSVVLRTLTCQHTIDCL